jgi:hypothetical protein
METSNTHVPEGIAGLPDSVSIYSERDALSWRHPIAVAVATKLGVLQFAPMSEGDVREAIQEKSPDALALMDAYFTKFLVCCTTVNDVTIQARDDARLKLIECLK